MEEPVKRTISLPRQIAQHLAGWRSAGVEFVPRITPEAVAKLHEFIAQSEQAPPVPPDPLAARRHDLAQLSAEVAACEACTGLFSIRTQTVFGEGPLDAVLCVIAAAPLDEDDEAGQPFAGELGVVLDRMLAAIGLKRDQVYICHLVKCRPPGRAPSKSELLNCERHLEKQLDLITPRAILCLGETAAGQMVSADSDLEALRQRVHAVRGVPVVCTYHPGEFQRSPGLKKGCWEDLKMLMRELTK